MECSYPAEAHPMPLRCSARLLAPLPSISSRALPPILQACPSPEPATTSSPAPLQVPGTELLRSAPAPQAPATPSQGMDFVLEQLGSKPPGYGSGPAAPAVPNFAAKPLDISESLGQGAAAASKALGGATEAAAGASKAASEAAAQAAAAAAEAAAQLKAGLGGALPAATEGASAKASAFLERASAELGTEASIIKGNLDAAVSGVQAAVDGAVGGVTGAVGGAVGGVASQVGGAAGAAYSQVANLLPPEVQDALSTGAHRRLRADRCMPDGVCWLCAGWLMWLASSMQPGRQGGMPPSWRQHPLTRHLPRPCRRRSWLCGGPRGAAGVGRGQHHNRGSGGPGPGPARGCGLARGVRRVQRHADP